MTCRCQVTGHEPGCPDFIGGVFIVTPQGTLQKIADAPEELPKLDVLEAVKMAVYREFGRDGYGTADIRTCRKCGKPCLHWTVSSSSQCNDCRNAALYAHLKEDRDMIRWTAQTVHQAYHQDVPGTWETCSRDICASAKKHLEG